MVLKLLILLAHLRGLCGILQSSQATNAHVNALPILIPHHDTQNIQIIPKKATTVRQSKGINLPFAVQISHQILVPTSLHVIPIHSSHVAHHQNHVAQQENNRMSFITQTHGAANVTHQAQFVPFLIPYPYHNQLVPIQDLSVIPLHEHIHNEHKAQFRAMMEKKDNEEDAMNRFRTFYGGFGTGLFFGGHGAGHGFYAYG